MGTDKLKTFRPWNHDHAALYAVTGGVAVIGLIVFLVGLAAEHDLEVIDPVLRQKDSRGDKAYAHRMWVVLLLYAYCVGMTSSREIKKPTGRTQHSGCCPATSSRITAESETSVAVTSKPVRTIHSGAENLPEGGVGEPGLGGAG